MAASDQDDCAGIGPPWGLTAYVVACFLVGCAVARPRDDGSPDAATVGTSRDAALRDARASPRDGGHDGSAMPASCPVRTSPRLECADGDPRWELQPGLAGCNLERAGCPENVLPLEWRPCPSGPPSCRVADLRGLVPLDEWPSAHDGTRGLVPVVAEVDGHRVSGILSTEGRMLAAWRDGTCAVYRLAAAPGGAAAIVMSFELEGDWHLLHAPIDSIARVEHPIGGAYQALGMAASRDGVVMQFNDGPDLAWCGGRTWFDRVPPSAWTYVVDLALVEPTVLWTVHEVRSGHPWFDRAWLRYGTREQDGRDYYVPPPGYGATAMVTDGTDITWIQLRDLGDGWGEPELWTAPFTHDPERLAPRRVAALPDMPLRDGARVGGGLYVFVRRIEDGARAALTMIELASGAIRTIPTIGVASFGSPVYVTADEMALVAEGQLVLVDPAEL